jgi:3-deoxy-D-manno-octulosonate 8-phosphate phosphatase (KDO 8-P phosphatase)
MLKLAIDVDGCLTDGKFYYDDSGKKYKSFGPEDTGALKRLMHLVPDIRIVFISADHRGFEISKKRVNDMGFDLLLIKEDKRVEWLKNNNIDIYMGDSIFDIPCFEVVKYSICPSNAWSECYDYVDHVCDRSGGSGAIAEACIHIWKRFYNGNFEKFIK